MDEPEPADHRLWWEREAERMLRDLLLYPVPVETMGETTGTTEQPGAEW